MQINKQKISTQIFYFALVITVAGTTLQPFNISGVSPAVFLPTSFVVLITVCYQNGRLIKAIIPIGVFTINIHTYAENLGDRTWLSLIATSDPKELWLSSLGGHAALQFISEFPQLIQYLPPVLGTLSSILIIFATREEASPHVPWFGTACAALVGTLPMFSRGYVEVTPYSVPVAILAIIFIQDLDSADKKRCGFAAGLVSMLAFLMHGIFLLLVALLFFAVLIDTQQKDFRKINQVLYGSLVALVFFALLIISTGKTVVPGDAFGGGDNKVLPSNLFAFQHLQQTLFLFVLSSPLAILLQERIFKKFLTPKEWFVSGFFFLFLFLWNFDLGWQRDLDLIWAASLLLLVNVSKIDSLKILGKRKQLIKLLVLLPIFSLVLVQTGYVIH